MEHVPTHGRARLRRPVTGLVVALLAAAGFLVATPAVQAVADDATSATPAGRFVSITPTRVMDSRSTRSFGSGETRVVDTGAAFAPRASAVVVNLTVVTPSASGFLAAYPAGTARPAVSNLNFATGQNRANLITVAVGSGSLQDDIAVYVSVADGGRAHVVVDVVGYYGVGGAGAPAGTSYRALATPSRIFDTRNSIGALTNTFPRNTGVVKIDYGSPAVNKTISAVAMTITVTQPTGAGFLTMWNGVGAPPHASQMSWVGGQSIGNLAIIPVRCSTSACTTVEFWVRNFGAPSIQLVGDISGMYATPGQGGLLFTARTPVRITDTRVHMGYGTLLSQGVGTTALSSLATANTRAIAMNVQAVKPRLTTWLTSWPSGTSKPPVTNLNARAGFVDAIAAQTTLGANKAFNTSAYWGPTDVVIDLAGTFDVDTAAAAAAPAGSGVSSKNGTTTTGGTVSGGVAVAR